MPIASGDFGTPRYIFTNNQRLLWMTCTCGAVFNRGADYD